MGYDYLASSLLVFHYKKMELKLSHRRNDSYKIFPNSNYIFDIYFAFGPLTSKKHFLNKYSNIMKLF